MLELRNIQKNYKNFSLDCSLTVEAGKIVGFVGRNGSGKSTTFKAILDLIHIDGGEVILFGEHSKLTNDMKEKIGVTFADSGFSSSFVLSDIKKILKGFYKEFDEQTFESLSVKMDIPQDKKLQEFSTGMLAKLKTLCAITHNAKLLILDEVTVGLDVVARNEVLDLLRDYMAEDESRAILLSSHISSDLESLCDEFYMIDNGRIVLHEDAETLLNDYAVLKVSETQFNELDKNYITNYKKEGTSYRCLTKQRQYYIDNYPSIIIEKGSIDDIIILSTQGEVL